MGKRVYNTSSFGGYLHELRRERGIGFDVFRNFLGVSKAYLNDVESDACRPPTPEVQIRMLSLLSESKKLTSEQMARFYSLAAEGRDELPADVSKFLESDDGAMRTIRLSPEYKKYWQKFGL